MARIIELDRKRLGDSPIKAEKMNDFLYKLPPLIATVSKAFFNALKEQIFEVARAIKKIFIYLVRQFVRSAKWLWAIYYQVEKQILGVFVDLALVFVALRYLFILLAIAALLIYFDQWLIVGIYLLLLGIAALRFFRVTREVAALQELSHKESHKKLVRLLGWPFRLLVSALFAYASWQAIDGQSLATLWEQHKIVKIDEDIRPEKAVRKREAERALGEELQKEQLRRQAHRKKGVVTISLEPHNRQVKHEGVGEEHVIDVPTDKDKNEEGPSAPSIHSSIANKVTIASLTRDIKDASSFAVHTKYYTNKYDEVWLATLSVLKKQRNYILQEDKQSGYIVTAFPDSVHKDWPNYRKYYITLKKEKQLRMDVKLFRYWESLYCNGVYGRSCGFKPRSASNTKHNTDKFFRKIDAQLSQGKKTKVPEDTDDEEENW
ncbi:MAG: hypothetical protein GXP09_06000 [Gammaproteobacteria bacterium]|nr:hypothetical protein [Gammaproteobacteria bacterium]